MKEMDPKHIERTPSKKRLRASTSMDDSNTQCTHPFEEVKSDTGANGDPPVRSIFKSESSLKKEPPPNALDESAIIMV